MMDTPTLSARAARHLAEARIAVGEDPVLQAAYLAGRLVYMENDGFHRKQDQHVREIKFKGVETIADLPAATQTPEGGCAET